MQAFGPPLCLPQPSACEKAQCTYILRDHGEVRAIHVLGYFLGCCEHSSQINGSAKILSHSSLYDARGDRADDTVHRMVSFLEHYASPLRTGGHSTRSYVAAIQPDIVIHLGRRST